MSRSSTTAWLALVVTLSSPASAQSRLEGIVDLHVHAAPDSRERSIDAFETAAIAARQGMRALLFKNHYSETASLAYLVSRAVPAIEAYGGVTLNRAVGGLNPAAIDHMAAMTDRLGRVVWLPTFDSEHNHRTVEPNPNFVPIARGGRLLDELHAVLRTVARHDLALATGHSSPEESLLVIRAARAAGIERIIVTHPSSRLVRMSVEAQREAARLGALLEYPVGLTLGGDITFEDFVAQIRAVGPEAVVLSTDLGQVGRPTHADGFNFFLPRLLEAGFTQAELDVMTKRNPARLLGLD